MTSAVRVVGRFFLLWAAAATAFAQQPRQLPEVERGRPARSRAATSMANPTCLIGSQMYDHYSGTQPLLQSPVFLVDYYPGSSVGTFRALTSPPVIDLAWGPDFALYGVTNAVAAGQNANSLFRIDPATGASTWIGSTGLQVQDGDLATDPTTGTIYGVNGNQLFRFSLLTSSSAAAQADVLGPVNLPSTMTGWVLTGLAFDSAGSLYALARSPNSVGVSGSGPEWAARLLRLDRQTLNVITNVPLSLNVRNHGALEFADNRLFFAEGFRPGPTGWSYTVSDRFIEINRTTGAATDIDASLLQNGLSALVTCQPHLQTCRPPFPDMVAWYPMDTNFHDRILGNNAVATGAVAHYNPGHVDRSVIMGNGYLTIPSGPLLNQGLGDFSINLWVFVDPTDYSALRTYVDKRGSGLPGIRGWSLFTYNGKLGLQLADGGYANFIDSRTLQIGWRHIAVTIDRDNPQGIQFYIDGAAGTPQDPTGRQGNLDNPGPTYLGRSFDSNVFSGFRRLDEVQFFDRVLRPLEIAAIFEAGVAGTCK